MRSTSILAIMMGLALAGCGDDNQSDVIGGGGGGGGGGGVITPACTDNPRDGILYCIEPGDDATAKMTAAMIEARPGDTIEFKEGYFELTNGLQLASTEDVLIKGQGMDKTVLSFKNSTSQEGLLASTVRGIVVEDLTILDSPGDGIKLQGVDHGTLRRVRTFWSSGRNTSNEDTVTAENFAEKMQVACTDPATENPNNPNSIDSSSPDYTVSINSGRYGIYPVNSQNILVEDSESIGASDAGIYVGQTDNTIIRNSRAAFNVFGFEIENVRGGEYVDNLAECNTGGFLVYDLNGLTRYGSKTRMYRNKSINNNTYNFAEPGSIVSNVPRGVGMITLAYDKIDIFDNEFRDNGTAGIVHTSYELMGDPGDRRLDMYTEGVHVFNNIFVNNGNDLPQPDYATIVETGGDQVTSAFPMLVGLKVAAATGEYRGAHYVWDGYSDTLDQDCPYPVDDQGQPIPQDEEGKPVQSNKYPNPDCRYNAYKFDSAGERKKPDWWFTCIDESNNFADDSLDYANFHGTDGIDLLLGLGPDPANLIGAAIANGQNLPNFPADTDRTEHSCVSEYGTNLPALPPVIIPAFQRSGTIDPAPAPSRVDALCNAAVAVGEVNQDAYEVNCPDLAQYNLFEDPQDPMSMPNGNSVPFVLNSKLFSDYSTKYRTVYLPDGQTALWRDHEDSVNSTILYPVGTIIAKTFAFANESSGIETAAETRLLIKRKNSSDMEFWAPLEYKWQEVDGVRVAKLTQGGDIVSASWNYTDVNSGVLHSGSTDNYSLPNANQCQSCHANDDAETGAAPIGPKPRNLNRPFASESPIQHGIDSHPINGVNQLIYMCQNGFMTGCPTDMVADPTTQYVAGVRRNPKFNVAGDSGFPADSAEDIEARVRSYLEVNCAHCHNPRGLAQNTGFYMDVFRPVNDTYGICKNPTATGTEGRGGNLYDIVPGNAGESIVPYRLGPDATSLAARMPPLARSVVHTQAVDLIETWINDVVDDTYPNADACASGSGGGLLDAFTAAAFTSGVGVKSAH